MTKQEWTKVQEWWATGHGSVEMKVDEHEISLFNVINKKKMIVTVQLYVDGYIKGAYTDTKSEIGNRFYQRVKKPLYSAKRIKDNIKAFGKRSEMAKQRYYEYNAPDWRSFAAFKKHLTSHNTELQLISCGWENNTTSDAPTDQ